ncbi:MAG: hypothetical protein KAJ19_21115 [Gammaproteobacteria bacterium]|nr:hypothetical protein [Gammaproteobacteria bacterium]
MINNEYKPGKSSRMYPILLLLNEYGPMTTADLALNLNVTTKQLWRRMTTYEQDYKIINSKFLPKTANPKPGRRKKLYKINKKGKAFLKHMIKIKTLYPDQWGLPNYNKWKNPSFEQWINKKSLSQC